MGDPHHNTWGGKNNSWGNRNKAPSRNSGSSRNSSNNSNYNGDLSPFGKAIIGGVILYTLSQTGLGFIPETIGNFMDAVDLGKEVSSSYSNSSNKSNVKRKTGKKAYDDVDKEFFLSDEDVASILEYVVEKASDSEYEDLDKTKAIFLKPSAVKNDKKFKKEILNKIDNFGYKKKNLQFFIMYDDNMSTEEMKAEYDRVSEIAMNNTDLPGDYYHRTIHTSGYYNNPEPGKMAICIEYTR